MCFYSYTRAHLLYKYDWKVSLFRFSIDVTARSLSIIATCHLGSRSSTSHDFLSYSPTLAISFTFWFISFFTQLLIIGFSISLTHLHHSAHDTWRQTSAIYLSLLYSSSFYHALPFHLYHSSFHPFISSWIFPPICRRYVLILMDPHLFLSLS